jgi:glycosyltransferase involved in cell wall biosynthesis
LDDKASAMKNQGKRILFLSYDGLTDPLGQSQILPYLAGLRSIGYQITIVSFEKRDRFINGIQGVRDACVKSKMDWYPLQYHRKPPILSTIADLIRLRGICIMLSRKIKFDIVHCRSYITAMVGMAMQKKYGTKFIFDMRGFWADERVEGGLWNLRNPIFYWIYKFFKRKEKELLLRADHVVVLTEEASRIVRDWGRKHGITVIPCCVDLDLFNPKKYSVKDNSALRQQLNFTDDDFILVYVGSIGTWYLFDEMKEYFYQLKKVIPTAKLLILTPDVDRIVKDGNVRALAVPREDVPRHIAISDVSICFIRPSFSKKGSSATKIAEVLAMGKPVVTNPGWGDVDTLATVVPGFKLVQLGDKPLVIELPLFEPRNIAFTSLFSLQSGVAKYASVYRKLLKA